MAILPKRDILREKLDSREIITDRPRPYLGYSGMAASCLRALKYGFHWSYDRSHPARVERIFRRGDYEETVLEAEFKTVGVKMYDDQLEVAGGHGYAKGHIDGKVDNVPGYPGVTMLLEIKTMNDKRFREYSKKGLRETNPTYYGQIMSYMGKLGLDKTLYVVSNKNDESRAYTVMDFDEDEYGRLEDIANAIPTMTELPEKIGGKTWFSCKYCDARQVCHYGATVKKTCRSCKNISIEGEGKWGCLLGSSDLGYEEQLSACGEYELNEMFNVQ